MPRHAGSGNTPAASPTNPGEGCLSLPALGAGAIGTVTITDKDILAGSVVQVTVVNLNSDATASRRVTANPLPPAVGSCVVEYKTDAAMSAAWGLWYQVIS